MTWSPAQDLLLILRFSFLGSNILGMTVPWGSERITKRLQKNHCSLFLDKIFSISFPVVVWIILREKARTTNNIILQGAAPSLWWHLFSTQQIRTSRSISAMNLIPDHKNKCYCHHWDHIWAGNYFSLRGGHKDFHCFFLSFKHWWVKFSKFSQILTIFQSKIEKWKKNLAKFFWGK